MSSDGKTAIYSVVALLGITAVFSLAAAAAGCLPPPAGAQDEADEQLLPEAQTRLRAVGASGCLSRAGQYANYNLSQAMAMAQCVRSHCDAGLADCGGWSEEWIVGPENEGTPLPWVLRHCLGRDPFKPRYNNNAVGRCSEGDYGEDLIVQVNAMFGDRTVPVEPTGAVPAVNPDFSS